MHRKGRGRGSGRRVASVHSSSHPRSCDRVRVGVGDVDVATCSPPCIDTPKIDNRMKRLVKRVAWANEVGGTLLSTREFREEPDMTPPSASVGLETSLEICWARVRFRGSAHLVRDLLRMIEAGRWV